VTSKFTEAYSVIKGSINDYTFSSSEQWKDIIRRAKLLLSETGFDVGQSDLVETLRKTLESESAVMYYEAAGEDGGPANSAKVVDNNLAKRLGVIKTLRHTYFLKQTGGHKVWIVNIPTSFTDWPHIALKGGVSGVNTKLKDVNEKFSTEDRKNLSNASQEALKWVQKAMIVASDPKNEANQKLIRRWFADQASTDESMSKAAGLLNSGLKKVASRLQSGCLIYTDSVSERGTQENAGTEAFVWGDKLDVVYVEDEFFGIRNSLTGLVNWTRIVVHELTHREVKTKDHAYEHQAINPTILTETKAIENADSWAWFCADCAGALTKGNVTNALNRT
jgi:hypothetical protein